MYRAIVGKRQGLALSFIANVVLVALLLFKSAPQPSVRRCLVECLRSLDQHNGGHDMLRTMLSQGVLRLPHKQAVAETMLLPLVDRLSCAGMASHAWRR